MNDVREALEAKMSFSRFAKISIVVGNKTVSVNKHLYSPKDHMVRHYAPMRRVTGKKSQYSIDRVLKFNTLK